MVIQFVTEFRNIILLLKVISMKKYQMIFHDFNVLCVTVIVDVH